jgi:GDP-4-dehydro-6-deoxy-D-mannose reductase
VTPYATSKAAAELGALEAGRRTGLRVIVVRPFPHTGPGQATRFVVPGFIERIRLAQRMKAPAVNTGNLAPVRDLLDVRDVVEAYLALLERGVAGEVYNVASGEGIRLEDLFFQIAALLGCRVIPERDASLARATDIPHLVGNAEKLRAATGWAPRYSLDRTLQSMLDAEAH